LPGRFSLELCEHAVDAVPVIRSRANLLVRGESRELGNVLLEHEWS